MKKILIALVIILSIGGMIGLNILNSMKEDSADNGDSGAAFKGKAIDVTAQRIVTGEISSSVLVSGAVEEINKKNVIADMPLDITKVMVEEGDMVKKGEVLFAADLSSLEDELAGIRINYDIQTLQLEKLQHMSSNDAAAQIGVELARLSLASARRAYDTQTANLEKNQQLFDEGIISQSELDAMSSGIEEAKSAVNSAALSLEQSQSSMTSSKESTAIDIQVQLKNLESLDMNIAKLEKQIEEIKAMAEAPMTGVVTMVNLTEGESSQVMIPLLTITDVEQLQVTARVREYDIKNIALEQKVYLTGDAIPDDVEVIGEVSYIAPVAGVAIVNGRESTAVTIEVDVVEGADYLKPGYKTDCEIMTELREDVVIADYTMFREDKEGNTKVFVVHDNGRIEERIITLGITSDFDAEITDGLEVGDVVITNPSLTVKDGMKANIMNSLDDDMDSDESEEAGNVTDTALLANITE